MNGEIRTYAVALGGVDMQLQPSEIDAVAAGLGEITLESVVAAVEALPVSDRAPAWELAIRHYARRKPLDQAAGEIGVDRIRARALMDSLTAATR
jgi:hypothetical protein